MQRSDLLTLARLGADARIAELQREIDAIRRKFPGLKHGRRSGRAGAAAAGRSRNISAAGRRAIAAAARRRWAAWRKARKSKG